MPYARYMGENKKPPVQPPSLVNAQKLALPATCSSFLEVSALGNLPKGDMYGSPPGNIRREVTWV